MLNAQLALKICHDDLLNGALKVVLTLFSSWNKNDCVLTICTNGITNKLVKVDHDNQSVLVRTYGLGSDILIDRDQEWTNLVTLSKLGLSPQVHGRFNNGIVYGYTPGLVFSTFDMSDDFKSNLVANHLAVWHKVSLPNPSSSKLFDTLHKWIQAIPSSYSNPLKQAQFVKDGWSKSSLLKDLKAMESFIQSKDYPVVFCHNDLLSGNIIYNPILKSCHFIDYEYANYSYRGFDIANHFCEWAGFECDWSLLPSSLQSKSWLSTYWTAFYGTQPTRNELDSFEQEIQSFTLVAHFLWTVWSLVPFD